MPQSSTAPRSLLGSLVIIGVTVALSASAFAYTAGWLTPGRLTPVKILESLAPPGGPVLGHRRNHAKGICFTGVFDSNGSGAEVSRAAVFASGQYPILGRFNLGTTDPKAPDATARVRGLGLEITAQGQTWRSAMINAPIFAVSNVEGFYALQEAARSTDPQAMKTFVAAHPEFVPFATWAGSAPWTASYAEDAFNGLNAFLFVDKAGKENAVRWSFIPQAPVVPVTHDALTALGPDHLDQDITDRVGQAPQSWKLVLTVADPGDQTADPAKAWPEGRRTIDTGTLVVQKIEAERDGPCRDINFDPTILPDGIKVSDDPLPAARSAAYARSFDLRTSDPYHRPATASAKP